MAGKQSFSTIFMGKSSENRIENVQLEIKEIGD